MKCKLLGMHFILIINWIELMHQHCKEKYQFWRYCYCVKIVLLDLKGQRTSEQLLLFSQKALIFPQSLVLVSS